MIKIADLIEKPLRNIFPKLKLDIPSHLEGRIAEFRKYVFNAFPMAIIKRALKEENFLIDTSKKSIPMILVVDKEQE